MTDEVRGRQWRPPVCVKPSHRSPLVEPYKRRRRRYTVAPNVKKPAKNEIQKIREIDGSYLYMQRFDNFFEYVVLDITGNGSYLNLQKLA